MQVGSSQDICHITIICKPGVHKAHIMSSLSAISECMRHMPCPQALCGIALYYFLLPCVISYYIAIWALHTLCALNLVASEACTMTSPYAVPWIHEAYNMPSLHAVLELARHMSCHLLYSTRTCDTSVMSSFHTIPELAVHMPGHHYMQFWSTWGIGHALIKCNFWAWEAYAMPSAITSYWFALVCITLYYFILHCTLSFATPIGSKPWCHQDIGHVLVTCGPRAWLGMMPCPHYMQFCSLQYICHAIITCLFWA
jgi:hypothetical protein